MNLQVFPLSGHRWPQGSFSAASAPHPADGVKEVAGKGGCNLLWVRRLESTWSHDLFMSCSCLPNLVETYMDCSSANARTELRTHAMLGHAQRSSSKDQNKTKTLSSSSDHLHTRISPMQFQPRAIPCVDNAFTQISVNAARL